MTGRDLPQLGLLAVLRPAGHIDRPPALPLIMGIGQGMAESRDCVYG